MADCSYKAMAPDLRRKVDETRRARLALEEGMKQQQNAQVGSSFSAVSRCVYNLVFVAGPRVCETHLGRPTKAVTVPVTRGVLTSAWGLHGSSQHRMMPEWATYTAIAYIGR